MASESRFEKLPPEITELIVHWLDFNSMCNLRLVSKHSNARSTYGLVKSDFEIDKILYWTNIDTMQSLADETRGAWGKCLFQWLGVYGRAVEAPQIDITAHQKLICEVFRNVQRYSPRGGLQTLIFYDKVFDPFGSSLVEDGYQHWCTVSQAAACAVNMVMRALASAPVSVRKINIFNKLIAGALACDQIAPLLDCVDLGMHLSNLTHLSLSLSSPVKPDAQGVPRYSIPEHHGRDAARLLALCTSLKTLNVRWLRIILNDGQDGECGDQNFLAAISNLPLLSGVQTCRLEGFRVAKHTLSDVVSKMTGLRSFVMREVHLTTGTWRPIFDRLINRSDRLERLGVDDLFEANKRLEFWGPGDPHFRTRPRSFKPNHLEWPDPGAGRSRIRYRPVAGIALESSEYSGWLSNRHERYGPLYEF